MSARRGPTRRLPSPPGSEGSPRGFTITELLVTLAVVSIVLALIYQIFVSQQRSYTVQEEVADAQQNARVAVDELTRALTSLGAGVDAAQGQVRILVAHPYEIVFNADLSGEPGEVALPHGTALPAGWVDANDPYQEIPGSYDNTSANLPPAETHRYYLAQGNDHYTLYHQLAYWDRPNDRIVWGQPQEVAFLVANPELDDPSTPAAEEPLFAYFGDFDGTGTLRTLDTVDTATSPLVGGGNPLDRVIHRIDVNLVAETAHPDPRYAPNRGFRQIRLKTSITPRNLWDCPVIAALPFTGGTLQAPDIRTAPTPVGFRVTQAGIAVGGQTVTFQLTQGPAGYAGVTVTAQAVSDPTTGEVTAVVTWPDPAPSCADHGLPLGTYTVTATTPATVTPAGVCSPDSATIDLTVGPGAVDAVWFQPGVAGFGSTPPAPATVRLATCGAAETIYYRAVDACWNVVQSVGDTLGLVPDPLSLGLPNPSMLAAPEGSFEYTSPDPGAAGYASLQPSPAPSRGTSPPNPYTGAIEAQDGGVVRGQLAVEIYPQPLRLVGLTGTIPATPCTDCPSPTQPIRDTFGVEDGCGNPVTTLIGNPLRPGDTVTADLALTPAGPPPPPTDPGIITSTNNPPVGLPSTATSVPIRNHDGSPGEFDLLYQPPTCVVGGLTYRPEITLTPSWPGGVPTTFATTLEPCTGCSVQVLDPTGASTTSLNQVCDAESEVLVTQCVPTGTTVELVIEPQPGSSGQPSFDRITARDRTTITFTAATAGQTAGAALFLGTARTGDAFRVVAYIPDQATATAPPPVGPGVVGTTGVISMDTQCSEILISPVADNPQAVPQSPLAQDTPLCAAEGSEVFFRVKDCDQNVSPSTIDFIRRTAGTSEGLIVEVVDTDGTVLDREGPDLEEVDIHGIRATDEPYFQGRLPITQHDDPIPEFSGQLFAPADRIVTLRANYRDPDDPADIRCLAEALLIPPLPVCLVEPVISLGDWQGDLLVHGGDAAVAGDLLLPATPRLVAKDPSAPLAAGPFGADAADRFFNAYTGGRVAVGGAPLPLGNPVNQPFTPGGAGQAVSETHPNYFQNVPDVAGLASRLDYERLKTLAVALRVYWEPAGGGLITNPATGVTGTFQEVTALPGPGLASPTHDGAFLFVDGPAALRTGAQIDAADLSALPTYTISGDYFTEGLLYVVGSVVIDTDSGQHAVSVEVAADRDARYDEANGGFSRADLPLDFAAATAPLPAGTVAVNLAGALYTEGEVRLPGGPRIYGVVAAERGVRDADAAEVWYDPRWRESRLELCSQCCGLTLSPAGPRVALGTTLTLTANRPQGAVSWESLAPQVATVDAAGLVTPVAEGRVVIRATDATGCVAEAEVEVFCGLSLASSQGTQLAVGEQTNVTATRAPGVSGAATWASDVPSVLSLDRTSGNSVVATAEAIGSARVTATDAIAGPSGPSSCEAALDFMVNCPQGRTLTISPSSPVVGQDVTLAVFAGGVEVSAEYGFTADGNPLGAGTFSLASRDPVSFEARLSNGQCPVGPVTVTAACPAFRLVVPAGPTTVGTPTQLRVLDPSGTDVTADFTFEVSLGGTVVGTAAEFTPTEPGTYEVTANNPLGCTAGPETFAVSSP